LAVDVDGRGGAESRRAIDNAVTIGEKIPFGTGPRDLSMPARSQGAAWVESHD